MAFRLDKIVPWGRNFAEYRAMFSLKDGDLAGSILGCADGPASFNAELTSCGGRVISADPLYSYGVEEIRARIEETSAEVLAQARRNEAQFLWNDIASVEELGRIRADAMDRFLSDYESGSREGRYLAAELPVLPFPDKAFDLALCSHFLFLYSDMLGESFHLAAIRELARLAAEVRIFPLLDLGGSASAHLKGVAATLKQCGYAVSIERVDYEFQRGGNKMMRVRRQNG